MDPRLGYAVDDGLCGWDGSDELYGGSGNDRLEAGDVPVLPLSSNTGLVPEDFSLADLAMSSLIF